jgi:uncharacterized protein (TIGR00369 family)
MNPDKTLLADFLGQENPPPTPVRSNALAIELGATLLQASSAPGRVVLHCRPSALFVQGAGVLQGGALAAMLDFAMSFAGLIDAPAGKAVTTTTLNVAFLRAAPRGDYRVVGEIERLGRNVAFAHARLFADDGAEPVASATSALLVVAERA